MIELRCDDPYLYDPQEMVLNYFHDGKFIDFDQVRDISEQEFNNQEGLNFQGLKLINSPEEKATDETIAKLEEEFGFLFPSDYKEFLKEVNGGVTALQGKEVCPNFCSLLPNSTDYYTLANWNKDGCMLETLNVGFLTIADAGQGFGGQTVICCREGKLYGKVFSWHNDGTSFFMPTEPLKGENLKYLMEEKVGESFSDYISNHLLSSRNEIDDDELEVLGWLESRQSNKLEPYKHDVSVEFIKQLYEIGVTEVFVDGYIDVEDEDDNEIDSFEIKFPDSQDIRAELMAFFKKTQMGYR